MSRDKPLNEVISREAAEWFVLLRHGEPDRQTRRDYLQWLKISPTHVSEILQLDRIHSMLNRAKLQHLTPVDPLDNVIPLVPLELREFAQPQLDDVCSQAERRPARPLTGRFAATLASIGIGALLLVGAIKSLLPDSTLTTGAGQWQKQLLEDGSIVHLGPNTQLRLEFVEQQRTVRLLQGEALFDVARDPARPFVVITEVGSVQAVGTQFGVSVVDGAALVTVSEGKVAVSEARQQSPMEIPVLPDQQVAISHEGAAPVRTVDAARELQWASGWIDIGGRTVGEVVQELNRRNHLQIIVRDPTVAALAVPPIPLELDAPEAFVSMVSDRKDIAAIRDSAGNIHLQRG